MSPLLILLVIAVASAKSGESNSSEKASSIKENLQKLREVVMDKLSSGSARKSKEMELPTGSARKQKSYGYFPYLPNPVMNYNFPPDMGYYFPQGKTPLSQEWRTEPFKRKNSPQLMDSPIYYVRLPPSPYIFVPGMGYVSRPPSLNEPGMLDALTENKPDSSSNQGDGIRPENFIHVPIDFVSNGKPTGVYTLPNEPISKPNPDSGFYNLDKGPYLYNGKPIELYVLRNTYRHMYADALTNFYP